MADPKNLWYDILDIIFGCRTYHRSTSQNAADSICLDVAPRRQEAYDHLLSSSPNGADFLFGERFTKCLSSMNEMNQITTLYKITPARGVEEFRRFISLKIFTSDSDARILSPTSAMDTLWHAAILDTYFYAELQTALGCLLHHRPFKSSKEEIDARATRLRAMKSLYKAFFLEEPLEYEEPKAELASVKLKQTTVSIKVVSLNGTSENFTIQPWASLEFLKKAVATRLGTEPDRIRLFYIGRQFFSSPNLGPWEEGQLIHCVPEIRGC
ncbi:Ubiquitin-like protein [Glarea lozoyensis ATCC 20868]|uniref:Ubiquitin-like protein n=1 Tax=Glarea lozoyensis (strain ATCC 20868 / MF5171) TaxID=1116229 RepID=S3CKT5_GLAL2|nr:Ubiquitin-like protein [Glarea lozoyensis ATCC 20868]EPE26360.1 Ubiquitin-like protein [Glarea lozoyensis ATCC 20868]